MLYVCIALVLSIVISAAANHLMPRLSVNRDRFVNSREHT